MVIRLMLYGRTMNPYEAKLTEPPWGMEGHSTAQHEDMGPAITLY